MVPQPRSSRSALHFLYGFASRNSRGFPGSFPRLGWPGRPMLSLLGVGTSREAGTGQLQGCRVGSPSSHPTEGGSGYGTPKVRFGSPLPRTLRRFAADDPGHRCAAACGRGTGSGSRMEYAPQHRGAGGRYRAAPCDARHRAGASRRLRCGERHRATVPVNPCRPQRATAAPRKRRQPFKPPTRCSCASIRCRRRRC